MNFKIKVHNIGPCKECGKDMHVSPRDYERGVKYERHPWCEPKGASPKATES